MFRLSSLFAALALMIAQVPSVSAATLLDTEEHPTPSILTLTLGFTATPFADSLGPTRVRGTMSANINLTEPNDDGTLEILSTNFTLDDIGPETLDLGAFGTIDLAFQGITYILNMGSVPVTANQFTIDNTVSGSFGFNGGKLVITNATGFLGNALGADPDDIDLGADPALADFADLTESFTGNVDDDAGLLDADGAEISFPLAVTIDVGSGLYLRIDSRFFVGSTAVPEASTLVMTGLAMAGLGGIGFARRRRRSK
jgi:MYXO-CTERM domain-containing protein